MYLQFWRRIITEIFQNVKYAEIYLPSNEKILDMKKQGHQDIPTLLMYGQQWMDKTSILNNQEKLSSKQDSITVEPMTII